MRWRAVGRSSGLLERAILSHPQTLGPRLLLRAGRAFATAEKALRAVLALDPRHAEARHNQPRKSVPLILRQTAI
jgi:hypothetical protein